MSFNFNRWIGGGYVTADATLVRPKKCSICSFSLAINEPGKVDIQSGQRDSTTSFINCKAFGYLADELATTICKGVQIIVVGKLRQEKWIDRVSGSNRTAIWVYLTELPIFTNRANLAHKFGDVPGDDADLNYAEYLQETGIPPGAFLSHWSPVDAADSIDAQAPPDEDRPF